MSDRKQTPDILGEILGGDSPASPPTTTKESIPTQVKPTRTPRPRQTSSQKPRSVKKNQWEYKVVSFQEYHGWRPRFVDGRELKDWMDGPLLQDYLVEMGVAGWELTTASSGQNLFGLSDKHQLYFKKPL